MSKLEKRRIGNTGLDVAVGGQGGAGLAGMYTTFDPDAAEGAKRAALGVEVNSLVTAPGHGFGSSEPVVGSVLSTVDRDSFVLSTKVGRLLVDAPERERGPTTPLLRPTSDVRAPRLLA